MRVAVSIGHFVCNDDTARLRSVRTVAIHTREGGIACCFRVTIDELVAVGISHNHVVG